MPYVGTLMLDVLSVRFRATRLGSESMMDGFVFCICVGDFKVVGVLLYGLIGKGKVKLVLIYETWKVRLLRLSILKSVRL